MSENSKDGTSRRTFLKNTGRVAAVSALAGMATPHVHAAEDNTLQVALIGCGGRGTGAAANALSVKQGPTKLVAMADVFQSRLDARHKSLSGKFADRMDVPQERRFVGHRQRERPGPGHRAQDVLDVSVEEAAAAERQRVPHDIQKHDVDAHSRGWTTFSPP